MYSFLKICRLFCFLFVFCSVSAAQAESVSSPPQNSVERKSKEIEYLDVTRATLSQLYWKMGAYKASNDTDVDNFLLINRCDLYRKLYRDDFAWHEVRVKAQESLAQNAHSFKTRFKVVQPIWLGRYNLRNESFKMGRMINTSRFEVVADGPWDCADIAQNSNIWKYPHRAIVNYSFPVEIRSIYVKPEIAKLYNEYYKEVGLYNNRPAFMEVSFKVFDAKPVSKTSLLKYAPAQISAVVERIDFYADQDLQLHISTLDYRKGNKERVFGN